MQNIYKEKFQVEASGLHAYRAIIAFPMVFRMFFGIIVDSKIITERKHYIIITNALAAIPMYLLANDMCNSPELVCACLFFYSCCH